MPPFQSLAPRFLRSCGAFPVTASIRPLASNRLVSALDLPNSNGTNSISLKSVLFGSAENVMNARRYPVGAEVGPDGVVSFRVWAPIRRRVELVTEVDL